MKVYNYIVLTLLFILLIGFIYLQIQYDNTIIENTMDGQAGIGKAVIGLFILGIALISFLISIITGILLIFKKSGRNRLSFATLICSLLLPTIIVIKLFL